MFTIHSKVPFDPHLMEVPLGVDEELRRYLLQLTDVLRDQATAINGDDVWEDEVEPAVGVRAPGTNPATYNEDTLTYDFSSTATNGLGFSYQLKHAWKEGTEIRFHMHVYLQSAAAAPNNVSFWRWYWVFYNPTKDTVPDLTSLANWNTGSFSYTHPTTARTSHIIQFPAISPTGKGASMILKVKVQREPTNGADLLGQVVKLDSADYHFLRNSSGSRREYVK